MAASASHSCRATAAPATMLTLADYVMQPPEGGPEGEPKDKNIEPKAPEPPETPASQDTVPQRIQLPAWASPDSTVRSQPAAGDTLGPHSAGLPFPASGAARPGVKPRRGVFGLHPIALLVGVIALHIFVVGLASK